METKNSDGPPSTFMIAGEGPYWDRCGQHIEAQAARDRLRASNQALVEALGTVAHLIELPLDAESSTGKTQRLVVLKVVRAALAKAGQS